MWRTSVTSSMKGWKDAAGVVSCGNVGASQLPRPSGDAPMPAASQPDINFFVHEQLQTLQKAFACRTVILNLSAVTSEERVRESEEKRDYAAAVSACVSAVS
jgi:hypothetical protein